MRETVKRRVVVTGLGPLTPVGHGSRGLYEGLRRERSAIDRITRFDPEPFPCKIAGEIRDFDPAAYLDAKRLRRLDRYSQFAVACGRMAIADARLDL
ncbi:MAG TPA: beta-ketoacyl synthase N-terminal-like domain-containing protein, partial [bacterium]|nr:beta-ketoacyl synthase N-terminal-like domain-containing protein [bacterium]